jgi:hypothetical protein
VFQHVVPARADAVKKSAAVNTINDAIYWLFRNSHC